MNATIRGLKGVLTLFALAGLGLGLRWTTAGSIAAADSHDLDSMTVLAIGTVAWIAYGWLVLAVVATVLEQVPGVVGAAASAIARRITSQTSRALLRSALGVAAMTPLTVGVAHADPGAGGGRTWTQVEPRSTVQPTAEIAGAPDWSISRTVEKPSTLRLTESDDGVRVAVPDRPTSGAVTRYTDLRPGRPVQVPHPVDVKEGDSLWTIAAAELGPNTDTAAVAARWSAWYAANRRLIGPDPDLILPGQVLRTPAPATGHPVPPTHQEK